MNSSLGGGRRTTPAATRAGTGTRDETETAAEAANGATAAARGSAWWRSARGPAHEGLRPVGGSGAFERHDLRGTSTVRTLGFRAGDVVVVSGLPGSGKSTLMRRVTAEPDPVERVDSQATRERWAARLPSLLPYAAYRPLARLAHYAGLRRALAAGHTLVVHDCGTQRWVRGWLARCARRRGRAVHLLLLDVDAATALRGQAERGRGVSARAFARHRRGVARLLADVDARAGVRQPAGAAVAAYGVGPVRGRAGRLPRGCASATVLDRGAAEALCGLVFR